MPFSIKTLRTILQTCFGIAPWTVGLDTDLRQHLHLTDSGIRQLLTLITSHTGLTFASDTAQHLTDVFDLMVHIIIRLHEDYDTTQYFGPIPERLASRLSLINHDPTLVDYAATHLN